MTRYLWLLVLLVWFGFPNTGWTSYQDCLRLYRNKKLSQAASCFEAVANGLPSTRLTTRQKARKGRALRNAANLLEQFASKSKNVEEAAYLRERAAKLLQRYLHENLYEVEYQKKNAELMMLRLNQEVGYATLTIIPGSQRARITLTGYQIRLQAVGTWSQTVRPGTYTLEITYAKDQPPVRKTVVVSPGKNVVVNLPPPTESSAVLPRHLVERQPPPRLTTPPTVPPTTSRGSRVAAWTTVGVGALVLLGGGAILVAASVTNNQKLSLHQQELTKAPSQRQLQAASDITQLHQTSTTLFPAGWIVLGVGAATTITGGFLFLLPTQASPAKP